MRLNHSIAMAMSAFALAASMRSHAQTPEPQPNPDSSRPAASDSDTADEILKALRRKRPQNDVIPSVEARARGLGPTRLLMPEGARVVDFAGRLIHHDGWWRLESDDKGANPAIRLLPNNTLEGMVRSYTGAEEELTFVVSGEMTVFQGENYLLPRLAARASTNSVEGEANSAKPSPPEPAIPNLPPDAPVEDVLSRLKELRPEQEVITGQAPSGGRMPGLASGVRAVIPEGAPLVSRPGRLIADGSWWTIVFESDHRDHPEPPIKLLPNQNVELMVQASERGSNGLVFVVSGEVTAFDGENYLLTRSAIRRVELGNLRR